MSEVMTLSTVDGIGVITIDSPPVNALGIKVRMGLDSGFKQLAADDRVKAIVLTCGGRTFFAGADISEFGKPFEDPDLHTVFSIIENGSKPVVAAIHGTALGGGLELALICHYRVAVPSAKLGLPEVNLGLLPGAGGTQRLPRIVGVEMALDMICTGRPVDAKKALEIGLIDGLASEGRLVEDAVAFARKLVEERRPLQRVRDRSDQIDKARGKPEIFSNFRAANARAFRGFKAPESIVKAIEAAVALPFDRGIEREHELFEELKASTESAAQRYSFFAERDTAKVPDLPADTPVLPVRSVGVIGAGTMGGGIAMNFLNVGLPVTIVEANKDALERGIAKIRGNYEQTAKKGRLSPQELERRMALLSPSLDVGALSGCELIIEAIFESMPVKKEMFARLDKAAKPSAILATNTSFLDVNEIASATTRPESVIGLHFFSPANVMRLLEIVRATKTSKPVLATALKLAKQIGKVPVVSGVCHGFIANRAMAVRGREADALILEGTAPQDIDRVIRDYGFAMGPLQMMDLVGLDVIGRDSNARTVMGDLVAGGRLGQKAGGGYYDYDVNRQPHPSPKAAEIISAVARHLGVKQQPTTDPAELLARLLYPVINEGARILEEGIALRASDIDIALQLGYGWPVYTGGPMFWANTVGLPKIVAKLRELEAKHGDAFKPAQLLVKLASEGGKFA
ncbi:MAG: 3-hydroxyacyl-CoA dehydrogenase NAD-binding domain-containing protein [Steroidobacteraceae bacterium]